MTTQWDYDKPLKLYDDTMRQWQLIGTIWRHSETMTSQYNCMTTQWGYDNPLVWRHSETGKPMELCDDTMKLWQPNGTVWRHNKTIWQANGAVWRHWHYDNPMELHFDTMRLWQSNGTVRRHEETLWQIKGAATQQFQFIARRSPRFVNVNDSPSLAFQVYPHLYSPGGVMHPKYIVL